MKVAYITLGCKVNQYETQAVELLLHERGHVTSDITDADVVVVNTCAVTGESARKSRQAARRVKRENGAAKLVICGCFSQSDAQAAYELGADFVGGTGERVKVVDYIDGVSQSHTLTPATQYKVFEHLPAGGFDGHARAFLKIQDGCNNYCSYCIIPYLRGAPRSLDAQSAAAQAVSLAADGYGEIVLTGIEISSYGSDIASDLATLVETVSVAVPSTRLRLGSLYPTTVTQSLVERLASLDNLCPHFHLSLQSGCDTVLERMRRKYTTDDYAAVVERLRHAFGDPAITTDLIVGFPGETDTEFDKTLEFIRRIDFAQMHIFPYSKRDGTRAADLPNHLPSVAKSERAARAAAAAADMRTAYLTRHVGKTLHLLCETRQDDMWYGHTDNYLEVAVRHDGDLRGQVISVRTTAVSGVRLEGEAL